MAMAPNKLCIFLALFLLVDGDPSGAGKQAACNSWVGECDAGDELLMESDIVSRVMVQRQTHITYGALSRDKPACQSAERGQSYRPCYPDPSNPYSRGCSRIYRCRGDS